MEGTEWPTPGGMGDPPVWAGNLPAHWRGEESDWVAAKGRKDRKEKPRKQKSLATD